MGEADVIETMNNLIISPKKKFNEKSDELGTKNSSGELKKYEQLNFFKDFHKKNMIDADDTEITSELTVSSQLKEKFRQPRKLVKSEFSGK